MPRRRRLCPIGVPQHIVRRGNDQQLCFASDVDLAAYANCLYEDRADYRWSSYQINGLGAI